MRFFEFQYHVIRKSFSDCFCRVANINGVRFNVSCYYCTGTNNCAIAYIMAPWKNYDVLTNPYIITNR